VLGSVDGENLALDGNEVQARLDGAASPLYLNREGGGVFVHHGQAEDRQIALTAFGRLGVGTQAPRVPLHVRTGSDIVSGTKSRGHLILGDDDAFNLALDNDEIQAKNNGGVATLHLQADGGRLEVHFNRAASERVVVTEGGNVGIGTASPNVKLHVQGSVRASSYLNTSDARLKEEVAELTGALETVTRLRGVRYRWRPEAAAEMGFEPGPQLGFLAQELEPHCPEAVDTDEEGMKSIRPHALLPLLVEAVKALAAENEALEARLARLEAAVSRQA
jgi:Chaperone of endosialidase